MRRQLRWLPILGILFLVASAGSNAGDGQKDKKTNGPPDYYPLQVGNQWSYKVTNNNKVFNQVNRISKTETINNQMLVRLDSPNVVATEHLFQNDKGIYRARVSNFDISPPFLLLPYPAIVGAKWTGEFTADKGKGAHKYAGVIQREESVEVPAGKFTALRTQIEVSEGGRTVRTTYWFVKDVGFVKQTTDTEGVSLVLELEKFEKKK